MGFCGRGMWGGWSRLGRLKTKMLAGMREVDLKCVQPQHCGQCVAETLTPLSHVYHTSAAVNIEYVSTRVQLAKVFELDIN